MNEEGRTRTPQETKWWVFHKGTKVSTLSVDEFVEKENKMMEEKEKKWMEKLSNNGDQRISEEIMKSRKKLLRVEVI